MTKDEIIRMAREAGIARWHKDLKKWVFEPGLERFAALVAAAEREACAKVAEARPFNTPEQIAAAIRARGNT
jgi:hypothetical protein